jgi:hypothetical protein
MKWAKAQGGSISVEIALLMLIILMMLAPITLFGRLLWYYSVAKSATMQGARLLATAPPYTYYVSATRNAALAAATATVTSAAKSGGIPDSAIPLPAEARCDGVICGVSVTPSRIKMSFQLTVSDNLFPNLTSNYTSSTGFVMNVSTEVPYSGGVPVNALGAP